MFEYIRGSVISAFPGLAIVEAGGIGYRVLVPLSTSGKLKPGQEARLLLHHTINAEQGEERLYGFATERERELFEALLLVQGVGPSTALQMLCAASPDELIHAIAAGDLPTLKRLKGIGPKRAERLVIELKDKVAGLAAAAEAPRRAPSSRAGAAADAVLALLALGYPRGQSEQAVDEALKSSKEGAATEDLVKRALQLI
ncbi:Holliday junction branch migration protein RuvA [bacterium]|nr:MAG: Holliday junction branch migration protein RuvA [bacterium]RIK62905.1 MAG: Holliday junction branch migration protein RuvA [Planctomycetota bacterium]